MVVTWVLKLYVKKSFPLCKVLHWLLGFITEINLRLHCLLIRFNHNLTNIFIQQKQPPGYSVKKCYLQNLTKFAGKHLCKRLCALACSFIKKESLAQLFSFEFCEISNNTFFTPPDDYFWFTKHWILFILTNLFWIYQKTVIVKL